MHRCVRSLFIVCCLGFITASAAAQTVLPVLSYNVKKAYTDAAIQAQVDVIGSVTPRPQVLALQEINHGDRQTYVTKLNLKYGVSSWRVAAIAGHCDAGSGGNCTVIRSESVAILTMLPQVAGDASPSESRLMWYADDYWVARAAVRARIALSDGTPITVWSSHLPVNTGNNRSDERRAYIRELKEWAATFDSPRLFGGDFNMRAGDPNYPEVLEMTSAAPTYTDAWTVAGSGNGYTAPAGTPIKRIDYWFSDSGGKATPQSGSGLVLNAPTQSDHRPLYVRYTIQFEAPPPNEIVLLEDSFDDNSLNLAKWSRSLFSGAQDSTVAVDEINQRLEIGPLKESATGSHYNGIQSAGTHAFRGGYAYAALVQQSATHPDVYAMFTIGVDNNYYRWYFSNGFLFAEQKINGVKSQIGYKSYTSVNPVFLRIRHDNATNEAVFETAPAVAGPWANEFAVTWNSLVPLDALRFELKAGTSNPVAGPGTVAWDTFKAAIPPAQSEVVFLSDNFSGTALDTGKWVEQLLSGSRDATIPVAQNDRLEIGPLKQELSTHYNGIVSLNAFDLTGAYAYVQAAVAPSTSTQAEMHLTLVKDGSNNYRIFLKGTAIKFEKKVGNTKSLLGPAVTFDSSRVFWRIRHDSTANAIHFETAPSVNGAPGGWTSHVNVLAEFAITSVKLELKAGTDRSETTPPGTVAFDTVKAAK